MTDSIKIDINLQSAIASHQYLCNVPLQDRKVTLIDNILSENLLNTFEHFVSVWDLLNYNYFLFLFFFFLKEVQSDTL